MSIQEEKINIFMLKAANTQYRGEMEECKLLSPRLN